MVMYSCMDLKTTIESSTILRVEFDLYLSKESNNPVGHSFKCVFVEPVKQAMIIIAQSNLSMDSGTGMCEVFFIVWRLESMNFYEQMFRLKTASQNFIDF